MASFDENGKYIKTNWKAGDKITATKLNKIEESIEAVNDNDISRYDEMRDKFIILEAKDTEHDKELTDIKNTIADNKAAAELGDYDINSRMTILENELNEGIAEVTAQINQGKADMENPQIQTFAVTDAYKFTVDHDGMMPSLVTLNNIEGLSSVETNDRNKKLLVSTKIGTICAIDINGKNYAEDIVCLEGSHGSECIIDGTNITVRRDTPYTDDITAYAFGLMSIPTLEDGKKYCIFCDDVEISNGGASEIEIQSEHNTFTFGDNWNSLFLDTRTFNNIIIYDSKSFIMRLHCTVGSQVGEVTYKNLQIYEVKEMIVPDIQLNSLPNGVKDEIKDGMLIKRTKRVNLAELTWIPSSTNVQFPESEFNVYYTLSIPDFIVELPTWENEPGHILCNNIPSVLNIVTASADPSAATNNRVGISGHRERSELRIKVYRTDAPDVAALNTWLTNNNVHAVYELETPEYIPVDLTIKADKGDTVVINTTKTTDFTYDIQLNTRAQINSIQDLVNDHKHDDYLPLSGGEITDEVIFPMITIKNNKSGIDSTMRFNFDSTTQNARLRVGGSNGNIFEIQGASDTVNLRITQDKAMIETRHLCPLVSDAFRLGSDTNRWSTIYGGSIDFGNGHGISLNNGMLYITTAGMEFFFQNDIYSSVPCLRPQGDAIHLGHTSHRWNTIHLVQSPDVASDRSMKENIEYVGKAKSGLTYAEMYDFIKDDLELATYNFINQDKLQMNFIAQDLLVNADGTDNKIGQMIVDPVSVPTEEEIAEGKPYPTLSYDSGMYTSVLAGALKEAINKIEQLEARIQELENK